ncbi:pyridoxal phosphate-dependent aminotransferase [Candidatus Bathyarchaeota archaeon]|nr:pyridoxal phosphate-dependent aminotransferase [Candidatus Bathyarchaeota archaeon]
MFRSKWISQRADMVPWSGVRKMFNYAQKYSDVINLSLGEPDFDTPQHIIKAAIEAMKKGYTHYTPNAGLIEFREAVAEKLRKENGIDVDPETEVIATVGAMGALSLAMLTVVNPGDEVLIPNPGFASYEAQVILAEGKPVSYSLNEDEGFDINAEEIAGLITNKTRAILVNTPSNPTGSVLSEKSLKKIAEIAVENDLLVISDEAYEAITYDNFRHVSIASLPDMKDRTISIFSFSKTYAMTGWRIGFAAANEEIIRQMTKLQEHLAAHPSSISQMAAIAALRGPKDHIKKMVKEYSERRELIMEELAEIPEIKCFRPQGAFYVFPNIKAFKMSSEDFAMHILEKARVIIVPGTAFGNNGEGYVRISYAASKEEISRAMTRMKQALKT